MKNDNVYIKQTSIKKYNNRDVFNPSSCYPEGLDLNIQSDSNIYNEIRNIIYEMGLDKDNFGKKNWNPFGEFIKKGNNVVIKPNLVKHINNSVDGDTDSLITNFSVIRPIIDYTLIALNNSGSLVLGDAPVQECNFEEVVKLNNLIESINIYNNNGYSILLKDFRQNNNPNVKCTLVDLSSNSEFISIDKEFKRYAVTKYDLKEMRKHHNNIKHEYLIANDILKADVIINIPKPKTHRIAGMTACLKNFIGVNSKKEYIPHHRNGSINSGGDEYPERSLIKRVYSFVKNYTYKKNLLIRIINKILKTILKVFHKDRFINGLWYGNDTIWRSILDINKIVLYCDKNGIIQNKQQRIIFNIADMIISGEKEGPLTPSNKSVGLIVASFNSLNMDYIICKIMGFNPKKIKYITNGYKLKKYKLSNNNYNLYANNIIIKSIGDYNRHFIPTDGWKDYLYRE